MSRPLRRPQPGSSPAVSARLRGSNIPAGPTCALMSDGSTLSKLAALLPSFDIS